MVMERAIAVAVLAWTTAVCRAQGTDVRYYPEDLRQDLELVRTTLHQSHPDPYRYHTKAELDRTFEEVGAALATPMTGEEFIQAAMPVFRLVADAHTWMAPPAALTRAYEHSEPLIPLELAVLDGALFVDEELKGFRSLPSGSRLLAVNGHTATAILATLRAALVADGGDTTLIDRRIEREFPVLYRRLVERAGEFTVDFIGPDGEARTQKLFALSADEMERSYTPKGLALRTWRLEEMPDIGAGWLTLGSLDREVVEGDGTAPEKFIMTVMETLRKSGAATLVIDVRGAGGRDLGMAEQVFALIAREPYRVVQSMSVRSLQAPDSYKYAAPAAEFYASVGGSYLPDLNGVMTLRPDDPRLEMVKPVGRAFGGKVYVICDGLTREAGAAFVMLAKRSGRARIVGEETGSNAFSFCGGRELEITLPRTACILHVPLTRFVPDGAPSGPIDRGEMPHHAVAQQPWGLVKGKDTVRESLIEMIRELR